jgi:succinate dehydrogenase / fumarate reductase iron-sulfur subunit
VKFVLNIWRQSPGAGDGAFERHEVDEIDPEASMLEMLDVLNERIIESGGSAISFDSDCREGICGACSLLIDGIPHGPKQVTSCQVYMRDFPDGAEISIEPFRSTAFPVLRDLVVDRSPLDRIIESGGYISITSGPKPEPNTNPIHPEVQAHAMDAAICIGCGACVAACPNGSAMLFTGAKVAHLNSLPQGEPERKHRVRSMIRQHDAEGFGGCSNHGECQAACPQEISIKVIGEMNAEYRHAMIEKLRSRGGAIDPM